MVNEKTFLAPLSITKIPGIGTMTGYQLLKMGVKNVKTLSQIPMDMLGKLMGKHGIELWRKANGIDESWSCHITNKNPFPPKTLFRRIQLTWNFYIVN